MAIPDASSYGVCVLVSRVAVVPVVVTTGCVLRLPPCPTVYLLLIRNPVCAPKRTPSCRPNLSLAITMRASITTWRIAVSICRMILRISSRLDGMSCTKRMFDRGSTIATPRFEMNDPWPPVVAV